jgi:hypothetical protein
MPAHNFYGSSGPSGENTVFLAEAALLRGKGNEVVEFKRHSGEIRRRGFSPFRKHRELPIPAQDHFHTIVSGHAKTL